MDWIYSKSNRCLPRQRKTKVNNNNNKIKMLKKGVWTIDEHEQSLIPHGHSTSYESMSDFMKTRTVSQVKGYYRKNKNRLLRDSKKYKHKNSGDNNYNGLDDVKDDKDDNDGNDNNNRIDYDDIRSFVVFGEHIHRENKIKRSKR